MILKYYIKIHKYINFYGILLLNVLKSCVCSLGAVGAADVSVSRVRPRSSMTRRDSCTAVHYGLGEHLEAEEREVLSDLRTSFIPPESVIVPPNCVGGRRSSRSKRRSCSEGTSG